MPTVARCHGRNLWASHFHLYFAENYERMRVRLEYPAQYPRGGPLSTP